MTDEQWADLRERLERGMQIAGGTGNVVVNFRGFEVMDLDWSIREAVGRDQANQRTGTDG